ncbi:putative agmatine deiminase [Balamuthia mandrillaris]
MPAEWAKHKCCWMGFPYRKNIWPWSAKPAQLEFAKVALAIARFEEVKLCVSRASLLPLVESTLKEAAEETGVDLATHPFPVIPEVVPYDDSWFRDIGPTFVINETTSTVEGIDWRFNAWGGVYSPCNNDKQTATSILQLSGVERVPVDIVLEGGSIHVDGEGTLLTTESCLLNPNRNPTLSKQQIEDTLKRYLGVEKVIWFKEGLAKDDTDGHVDNLCCFAAPGVVTLLWTDDEEDPQYAVCTSAYEILSKETDAKGRKFTIHKVHQPSPLYVTEEELDESGLDEVDKEDDPIELSEDLHGVHVGERRPASYINYYIANGGIVVPQFGDEKYDKEALKKLKEVFPDREVVGVFSKHILMGGGNIHCITQQHPLA